MIAHRMEFVFDNSNCAVWAFPRLRALGLNVAASARELAVSRSFAHLRRRLGASTIDGSSRPVHDLRRNRYLRKQPHIIWTLNARRPTPQGPLFEVPHRQKHSIG